MRLKYVDAFKEVVWHVFSSVTVEKMSEIWKKKKTVSASVLLLLCCF